MEHLQLAEVFKRPLLHGDVMLCLLVLNGQLEVERVELADVICQFLVNDEL